MRNSNGLTWIKLTKGVQVWKDVNCKKDEEEMIGRDISKINTKYKEEMKLEIFHKQHFIVNFFYKKQIELAEIPEMYRRK